MNHGRCLSHALCRRSVSDIVKRAVIRTRGTRPREADISGHSLRVGAAQDLLSDGHDIRAIMRAGGWSDVSVAMRYLSQAEHNIWQPRAATDNQLS